MFGMPDEKWGEVPAAYVQLKPGAHAGSRHGDRAAARRRSPEFKRPRLVKIVDDFPKTPIGKIQKNMLRDAYKAAE